jgi:hypothetical protein
MQNELFSGFRMFFNAVEDDFNPMILASNNLLNPESDKSKPQVTQHNP